jgi:hypothetical protein
VTFSLRPAPSGTEVQMEEHAIGHLRGLQPALELLTSLRNKASLAALESFLRV